MDKISLLKKFVFTTSNHVFLTGRAGTGKTTLLKEIYTNSPKNTAIVAPTGIAALNAGGSTIHSFFQLPPATFIPNYIGSIPFNENLRVYDQKNLLRKIKMFRNKRRLLRALELLIIDEVSMLRSDLLDAIDVVLRHVRKNRFPFGGVQILFIGDLQQLPPVVLSNEKAILNKYYKSEFFFDAHALKNKKPVCIRLEKVHRQSETQFIEVLDRLRTNTLSFEDKVFLHSKLIPGYEAPIDSGIISLTTHNKRASLINNQNLHKLKPQAHVFSAEIEGDFNESNFPASKSLLLKKGAQVMFLTNDQSKEPKYYNGKVGMVESLTTNSVSIRCKDKDELIHLKPFTWENVRFQINPSTGKMEETSIGSFRQFPLKLAWAITIHKSQGLSFTDAVIDCEASFASGQLYVALSRLRSADGLILSTALPQHEIPSDERLVDYERNLIPDSELQKLAESSSLAYMVRKIHNVKLLPPDLIRPEDKFANKLSAENKYNAIVTLRSAHKELSIKVNSLMNTYESALMRSEKAMIKLQSFDLAQVSDEILEEAKAIRALFFLDFTPQDPHEWEEQIEILNLIKARWIEWFNLVIQCLQLIALFRSNDEENQLVKDIRNKVDSSLNNTIKTVTTEKTTPQKGKSKKTTMSGASEMQTEVFFRQGLNIAQIAELRRLKYGTIQSHLARLVHSGRIDAESYLTPAVKDKVFTFLEGKEQFYARDIEDIMPKEFSKIELELGYILYRKQLNEVKTA